MVKSSKSSKKSLDHPEFLDTWVRVGDAPGRMVDDLDDLDPLRPQEGEGVSRLQIIVSIAKKEPLPEKRGLSYFPGYNGPTLREVQFWVHVPQDENILASVLLYCWQQCIDLKPSTMQEALAELARVAASQGGATLSDVIKETRKLNTGGRPLGSTKKATTAKFEACFNRLKSANPQLSNTALFEKVVAETTRKSWGDDRKKKHRAMVKKALQRLELLPVTPKNPADNN